MNSANPPLPARRRPFVTGGTLLLLGAIAGWALQSQTHERSSNTAAASPTVPPTEPAPAESALTETQVQLPQASWEAGKITIAAAQRQPIPETLEFTGKIALNEDRVAHIFPLVEGRVAQVLVKFGDRVKKGDPLVIVQSAEIGNAKLALYQDRLARDLANAKDEWTQSVTQNTVDLIAALRSGVSMKDLEVSFRDRPMGQYRDRLLAAYATAYKSRIDFDRLSSLSEGGVAAKQLLAAEVSYDIDRVSLQAMLEQIEQESRHAALLSKQTCQEADTRVAVAETKLAILGYSKEELARIDPASEGEAISHYPILAPFDGTIISKDVVLQERVSPDHQILRIADLSTVWVSMDVYQQHLPSLHHWAGTTVDVRSDVWGDSIFPAKVFSTGDVINESSRTLSMRATADNADGRLKPGMFVTVRAPRGEAAPTLAVPRGALQEHEGRTFLFVHCEGDRFERRDVSCGRRNSDLVEITNGVEVGEPIVVHGGFALKSAMLADLMAGD